MGPISEQDIIALLREHFEQRLEKLEDAHLAQRLGAIEKLEDSRWAAHKDVHDMGQRAIDEAVKTLNTRLEGMNEFRAQIYQERTEFVKVPIFDSKVQNFDSEYKILESRFETAMEKNSNRISMLENNQSNQAGRTAAYGAIMSLFAGLLAVLISHFWK